MLLLVDLVEIVLEARSQRVKAAAGTESTCFLSQDTHIPATVHGDS